MLFHILHQIFSNRIKLFNIVFMQTVPLFEKLDMGTRRNGQKKGNNSNPSFLTFFTDLLLSVIISDKC